MGKSLKMEVEVFKTDLMTRYSPNLINKPYLTRHKNEFIIIM